MRRVSLNLIGKRVLLLKIQVFRYYYKWNDLSDSCNLLFLFRMNEFWGMLKDITNNIIVILDYVLTFTFNIMGNI